jgi:hypothetical protein
LAWFGVEAATLWSTARAREERFEVRRAELRRMALVVKMDVTSTQVDVGFLGADAVVLEPDAVADTGEESRRFWGSRRV